MAAIHHQHLGQAGLLEDRGSREDAVGVVIRPQPAAAQDNVAVPISGCADDARDPLLVDAQKTVGRLRGGHGVNGGLQAAIGRVLETDRHGQTAGHLAVGLRLRRARAYGRPAHQVADVLRHDRVQEFRRRRQTQLDDLREQSPGFFQSRIDVVGTIQVRVVDQSFPADARARFLEIHTHDDAQSVGQFLAQAIELPRVGQRPVGVMNRARTDDDQQARVFPA